MTLFFASRSERVLDKEENRIKRIRKWKGEGIHRTLYAVLCYVQEGSYFVQGEARCAVYEGGGKEEKYVREERRTICSKRKGNMFRSRSDMFRRNGTERKTDERGGREAS